MKYQKPFDQSDPNAPYVNGDPGTGTPGSIPPAEAIEDPQRELHSLIEKSGFTPSDGDLLQAAKAIRSQGLNYRLAGGTGNALTITLDPAPAALSDLQNVPLLIKIASGNTGASTLKVGALAATAIVRADGSALLDGDLKANSYAQVAYDGTSFRLIGVIYSQIEAIAADLRRSQVRADRGASTQVIPTGVQTRITNYGSTNIALFGGSTFSSGLLTIGAADAGLWFLSTSVRQVTGGTQGFAAFVMVNGSPVCSDGGQIASSSSFGHAGAARAVNLVAGDTVEMQVIQSQAGNVTFNDLYGFTAVRLGKS